MQVIDINIVGEQLSGLVNIEKDFTAHSARVGGAVVMAENGCDILEIQRAGGWRTMLNLPLILDRSIFTRLEWAESLKNLVDKKSAGRFLFAFYDSHIVSNRVQLMSNNTKLLKR